MTTKDQEPVAWECVNRVDKTVYLTRQPITSEFADTLWKCTPLYAHPTDLVAENGTWTWGKNEKDGEFFIESSDFTHDVRLYLNGDFADEQQKIMYLTEIAKRLNLNGV